METLEWKHWRDAVKDWPVDRWPDFSPEELACNGTGRLVVHPPSLDALQELRDRIGRPMIVNSAYRSPSWNKKCGGAKRSMHLVARAFDVRMDNHSPKTFEAKAKLCGFRGVGHYPKLGFMHIDTRRHGARWNKGGWFFEGAAGLPPEPPAERLKEAARDAATAGGGILAGGEVVATTLEQVGAVAPAGWQPWLFGAAALVAGGVALWRIFGERSAEPEAVEVGPQE